MGDGERRSETMKDTQTDGMRRLNNSHLTMAVLAASGRRPSEIARVLGYSANRVSIILQSPLFIAEVERVRNQFHIAAADDILTRLQKESIPTLEALVRLRDYGGPTDSVKLGAARELKSFMVDALPGLRHRAEQEAGSVKIKLDLATLTPLMQAMSIAEGKPVPTFDTGFTPAGDGEVGPIEAKTIDEMIGDLQSTYNE